jgi:hypothetical protein
MNEVRQIAAVLHRGVVAPVQHHAPLFPDHSTSVRATAR